MKKRTATTLSIEAHAVASTVANELNISIRSVVDMALIHLIAHPETELEFMLRKTRVDSLFLDGHVYTNIYHLRKAYLDKWRLENAISSRD
jgi:hypothetical protein